MNYHFHLAILFHGFFKQTSFCRCPILHLITWKFRWTTFNQLQTKRDNNLRYKKFILRTCRKRITVKLIKSVVEQSATDLALEKSYLQLWRSSIAWNNVMSLDAAAADMWRLGCFNVEASSTALAKVPTLRAMTRNWSMTLSLREWSGLHTRSSRSSNFLVSSSGLIMSVGTSAW